MRSLRSILLSVGGIVAIGACGADTDASLATVASAVAPPGFLDVTTLGAIGDGVTDDTVPLINAASFLFGLCPNQGICGLYFPPGVYLAEGLVLPIGREFTGAPGPVLRGRPGGGSGPVLRISAGSRLTNLAIDGNRFARPFGGDCVFASTADNVVVSNVNVSNCVTNGRA